MNEQESEDGGVDLDPGDPECSIAAIWEKRMLPKLIASGMSDAVILEVRRSYIMGFAVCFKAVKTACLNPDDVDGQAYSDFMNNLDSKVDQALEESGFECITRGRRVPKRRVQ